MSSATLIAGQYAIHRGREEGGEGRATGDLKTTSLTIENLLVKGWEEEYFLLGFRVGLQSSFLFLLSNFVWNKYFTSMQEKDNLFY